MAITARKAKHKSTADVLHKERFPGESRSYRAARNAVLKAEMKLRRSIEAVAALRRWFRSTVAEPKLRASAATLTDDWQMRMKKSRRAPRRGSSPA